MSSIYKAADVPLSQLKQTKIIATVGPNSNSYEIIYKLIKSGANGIRLNFSHGTEEERIKQIEWVRKASKALGKPVAIIQDLQGPKIRLGDFEGYININEGQSLQFKYKANYEKTGLIPTQYDLSKKVKRGERLLLFDGKIQTKVTSVAQGIVHARALNDGILIKRKGINLPDTDLEGAIITKKDKKDLAFGSTLDIDYVALSFVQKDKDIRELRRILKNLGSRARIIGKIENRMAITNMESIVKEADVVMVARGDLAIETRPEEVPIEQRRIIGLGIKHKTPTIVATQMLASMTDMPEPTRAEVSDIATAVIVGADCVMLSDETANGKFPVESVKVMKRVILYTQSNPVLKAKFEEDKDSSRQAAISYAVISLASKIKARAIVAETKSGATAINISAHRPVIPVIAVASDLRVAQQLAIVFGIKSFDRPVHRNAAGKLTTWLKHKKALKTGDIVVTASGKYPGVVGTTDTIKVRAL